MAKIVGVVDEPVAPGATDNLDINIHSRSLIKFIQQSNTPITVGIQGEWGSGKTSLINSIYHEFNSDPTIKQIWINSWEYSLLSTPEESLLKIINRIIEELLESDTDTKRKDAIKSGAEKIFKGALRVGAQVALGTEAAKVTQELLGSAEQGISALRKQLTDLVGDIANRSSNPYKKIVIYVDDLDRIEPRNAVAILELLKNIFSVPNCVFLLAIDYQVVVKGLEHKFGKQTPENEWEFRAFFDKIIQLPFMMPMGQYNIGKYVNALLVEIGFVEGEGLDDEAVREIILRTIGGNPRSIKRLVNSVSLIQIFSEEKSGGTQTTAEGDKAGGGTENTELDPKDEKFLLFSLLCLQIAYPPIYSLLNREPDFTKWDDKLALQETKRSEEDKEGIFLREFENAAQTEDFNEDWEKALYRICYGRPRMKARVADISKFFSYIKDDLLDGQQDIIGETIASVLSQTSVTSITSTDHAQSVDGFKEAAWKSAADKSLSNKLWNEILDAIEDTTKIFKRGSRKGSSGRISLTDKSVYPGVQFRIGQGPPALTLYPRVNPPEDNIMIMEKLKSMKGEIESQFGHPLTWKRKEVTFYYKDLPDAQILASDPDQRFPDQDKWPVVVEFLRQYAPAFESTMSDALLKIRHETDKEADSGKGSGQTHQGSG
jgi:hypothetical protein